MVLYSHLHFLTLKRLLLAALRGSHESLASCRESVSSCFLMPRGSCSHKSDAPCWTPHRKGNMASFYKEAWLWYAEIISIYWRPVPTTSWKTKSFHSMMKKNKYGRIPLFLFSPSDCPVGIKIPAPRYRIESFKMHKDRLELLLSWWPSAPQTLTIW